MSASDFGKRVAACSSVDESPRFTAIAEIIAIVLPILLNLPCFKSASAEQAHQKIESMPGLARLRAKALIRSRTRNPDIHRDAGAIADDMLNCMTESSQSEFLAVYTSARS